MKISRIVLGLGLSLLISSHLVHAKSRNCNASEKAQGDAYLLRIETDQALKASLIHEHLPLGIPQSLVPSSTEEILVNGGYVMAYDHDLRTSLWTGYHLTLADREGVKGKERVNCFRPDPRIEVDGPVLSDYKEPVFDRGHLANDADLKDELIEQINSYVMTNMSPQQCRFNRGIWLSAENLVRQWASRYKDIYVITGAIYDQDGDRVRDADSRATKMLSSNGKQNVGVPSGYYKVVYRPLSDGTVAAIGMLLDNTNEKHGNKWSDTGPYLQSKAVPLEYIEDVADLSLFDEGYKHLLVQDIANWDFSKGGSNMEYSCK
ncbi:DNA/RNA non-specific endonuclease [Paraglaciecola chathamensis]|uniref:Endonuclease n=1 Tax=Paraglaciecola agarilytica NO2 TaxID=1125747 RepID=A0ABQ0I379_9ALTE|nr:DNA/RNA non-specific endonuclease [Paraglaciecola agarilytica]GAC03791.1 endonuclease G, mitochondrial [Paraglaciecola agarilytica NO2]